MGETGCPGRPIDGSDNFEPLAAMTWQVHVYGSPMPELGKWCSEHNIPLNIFDWRSDYERAGLARNALYLLRPDTYVALADATGAPPLQPATLSSTSFGLAQRRKRQLKAPPDQSLPVAFRLASL